MADLGVGGRGEYCLGTCPPAGPNPPGMGANCGKSDPARLLAGKKF